MRIVEIRDGGRSTFLAELRCDRCEFRQVATAYSTSTGYQGVAYYKRADSKIKCNRCEEIGDEE